MADIQSFVNRLLSGPPGTPDSIQLEVDTGGDVVALFEVLLTIFIAILKSWYPPPISISALSPEHFQTLKDYFASFGIQLELAIDPIPPVLRINNKAYETKTVLSEMTFQMTSGSFLYTLRFR